MRMGLSKRQIIRHKYKRIVYKLYFYIIFLASLASMTYILYMLEFAFLNSYSPYAINIGSDAINYTVADYFSDNQYNYNDFVELSYNKNNSITSVQTNSPLMNVVKSELSILLQEELEKYKSKIISIPIGNISDNIIFHGLGPMIDIKINSAEVTDLVFNDLFESEGINQVRHKIYIEAYVTISISCATLTRSEVIHDTIPVAETVIVGNVPNYYSQNGEMQVIAEDGEDN